MNKYQDKHSLYNILNIVEFSISFWQFFFSTMYACIFFGCFKVDVSDDVDVFKSVVSKN